MIRNRTKAVTAVLVGLSLLVLSTSPASANAVSVTPIDGATAYYGLFETTPELVHGFEETDLCTADSAMVAGGGSFVFTGWETWIRIFPWPPQLTSSYTLFEGTYSGDTLTISSGTVVTYLNDSDDCNGGTQVCTVHAGGMTGTGTVISGTLPTMTSGDVITLIAGNDDFGTMVSGTDCGAYTALDNGRITLFTAFVVT